MNIAFIFLHTLFLNIGFRIVESTNDLSVISSSLLVALLHYYSCVHQEGVFDTNPSFVDLYWSALIGFNLKITIP